MKLLQLILSKTRNALPHSSPSKETFRASAVEHLVKSDTLTGALPSMKFLLACFPKSGSTYLTNLIGNLPGFTVESYVPAYQGREQELSEDRLLACANSPKQIAQHHVRASDYTLDLLTRYQLRPIILVRNIFDVVVSISDHIQNEDHKMPMAFFDDRLAKAPFTSRIDAVIDLVMPWYFNFYTSWWFAMPESFVTYEDIIIGGLVRQASFLSENGVETNTEILTEALRKAREGSELRLNVGKTGRGLDVLTSEQKERIGRLASHYPNVDFRMMGLRNKL